MKTLALEFSSALRSAAVCDGGQLLGAVRETRSRECGPVELMGRAMQEGGVLPGEIGVVAVGLGPGSYHGVRVAIALAQGWAVARGVRLVGVDTPGCLASQARAKGRRGALGVVVDAQRGEFYLEGFTLGDDGWERSEPLKLVTRSELESRLHTAMCLVGPEAVPGIEPLEVLVPDAGVVGMRAARVAEGVPPEALEPIYLRETQFVKAAASGIGNRMME